MLVKVPVILTFDVGVNTSEVAEAMGGVLAERAAKTITADLPYEIGRAEAINGETIRQDPRFCPGPAPRKGRTGRK